MLVKNWMSKNAVTADVEDSMQDAVKLMKENDIHMLSVLKKGRLVGIVTERDLESASKSACTPPGFPKRAEIGSQRAINEIMTANPVTVSGNHTIEDAAELLLSQRISGLPVVNRAGDVVGMITRTDLLRFIITTIGMGKSGIQFAVELVDRPGCVKEVTDMMRDYGGRVGTVFSTRERAQKGYRQAYIRIYDIDRPSLMRLKEVLKEKVRMMYVINYQEKMSEIF